LEEYGLNMAPFQATFKRMGQPAFPRPPVDGYKNANRRFVAWRKDPGYADRYYQGELDETGKPDGRGVSIKVGRCLRIGHYKKGEMHGQQHEIFDIGLHAI